MRNSVGERIINWRHYATCGSVPASEGYTLGSACSRLRQMSLNGCYDITSLASRGGRDRGASASTIEVSSPWQVPSRHITPQKCTSSDLSS
ncbi:hypothetical protein IG631_11727 [Alternaria alternata]|nr:hypothetical protein IG631_11727 [Alternaria alternata]